MKKLLVMILAGVMMLSCIACGATEKNEETVSIDVASAEELFTKIWDTYTDSEKFYTMGGHVEAPVENAPGAYDLEKAEDLSIAFCIPTEAIEMVDDAATLVHAMNANNFSAAVYHLTDTSNKQFVIDAVKETTLNNHWMCGFPEKLKIMVVADEYVVTAFGTLDAVETFATKTMLTFENEVTVSVDESLIR